MISRPWRRTGKVVSCWQCKKELYVPKWRLGSNRIFCSRECKHDSQIIPCIHGLPKKSDCKECYNDRARPKYRKYKTTQALKQWKIKAQAMKILGGRCVRCGTEDLRILQINHKKGDGHLDSKVYPTSGELYEAILDGRRTINDLEVMCANHNVLYEYECGRRYDFSIGSI